MSPSNIKEVPNQSEKSTKVDKGKQKQKADKVRHQDAYGDEWWIYVRCYLKTNVGLEAASDDVVLLTKELIKFGITGVLSSRSLGYHGDGGFFEYAFRCSSYSESKEAESMVGAEFVGCKLEGKQEYLRVSQAAGVLGLFTDKMGATEDQYSYLALNLFAKIVKTLHSLNPEHRGKFGFKFEASPRDGEAEGSNLSTLTSHSFFRTELTASDMPPNYETLFPSRYENIRKLELENELEKHRITEMAISSLISQALSNPGVDQAKLMILLQNVNIAFSQRTTLSIQPKGLKKVELSEKVAEVDETETLVKRFIAERMRRDFDFNVSWKDVYPAFQDFSKTSKAATEIKESFKKCGVPFVHTDVKATKYSAAELNFRGFKGWRLLENVGNTDTTS